jgi:hypothetical protein
MHEHYKLFPFYVYSLRMNYLLFGLVITLNTYVCAWTSLRSVVMNCLCLIFIYLSIFGCGWWG